MQLSAQATMRLLTAETALLDLKSATEARAVRPLLKRYAALQELTAHAIHIPGTISLSQTLKEEQAILQQLQQVAPELIRHGDFGQPVGVDPTYEPALLATRSPPNAAEAGASDVL